MTGNASVCTPAVNAIAAGLVAQNAETSMRWSPYSGLMRSHTSTLVMLARYAVTSHGLVQNPQVSAQAITVSGWSAVDSWRDVPSYTSRMPSSSRSRRRGVCCRRSYRSRIFS
jgi:hypothetical protein